MNSKKQSAQSWWLIVTLFAHFSHLSLCLFLAPYFPPISVPPFFSSSPSSFLLPPTRFLAVLGSRPPCLTSRLMCVCSVCIFCVSGVCVCVCACTQMCECVSCSSLDVVSSPVFVFLLRPADLLSQECYCYCCHTVNTHSLFLCSSPLFSPPLSLHLLNFSLVLYLQVSASCLSA